MMMGDTTEVLMSQALWGGDLNTVPNTMSDHEERLERIADPTTDVLHGAAHHRRRMGLAPQKNTDSAAKHTYSDTKALLQPVSKRRQAPKQDLTKKEVKPGKRRDALFTLKSPTDEDAESLFQNTKALLQPIPHKIPRRASMPNMRPAPKLRHVPRRNSMPTKLPSEINRAEALFQTAHALLKPVPRKPSPPPCPVVEPVVLRPAPKVDEKRPEPPAPPSPPPVVEEEEPVVEEQEPPVEPEPEPVVEEPAPEPEPHVVVAEEPAVGDDNMVEVGTSNVFVAFTMPNCKEEPSEKDYERLAKTTQKFYASHLKKKFKDTFQSIQVTKNKAYFGENKPNKDYNVYIEWDIQAEFAAGDNAPDRYKLCESLVNVNLMKYLTKHVGSLSQRTVGGAVGVFTHQVNSSLFPGNMNNEEEA